MKVCRALQELAVVVPKARVSVLFVVRSPPPCNGYVVEIKVAFDAGVKPKIEDEAVTFSVPLPFDV